jgi:hypothetical protein
LTILKRRQQEGWKGREGEKRIFMDILLNILKEEIIYFKFSKEEIKK